MKKIFTLLAALCFIPATPFDLHVYNLTNYDLYYMLGTRPIRSGDTHPFLTSRGNYSEFNSGDLYFVKLGSFEDTEYSNSGYPYHSTTTVTPASAQVTHWVRTLTPTSPAINTPNHLAQSMFGSTQRFSDFKFYMKDAADNVVSSGNLDKNDTDWNNPNGEVHSLGNNMTATYLPLLDNSGEVTDIFVLFDEI